jgi:hypothetical protein
MTSVGLTLYPNPNPSEYFENVSKYESIFTLLAERDGNQDEISFLTQYGILT